MGWQTFALFELWLERSNKVTKWKCPHCGWTMSGVIHDRFFLDCPNCGAKAEEFVVKEEKAK